MLTFLPLEKNNMNYTKLLKEYETEQEEKQEKENNELYFNSMRELGIEVGK